MDQQVVSNGATVNRVAKEIYEWKAREQRLEKLFSAQILTDKAFQREKLGFYQHLQSKYSRSNAPEEKMTLIILARQSEQLRKQLYPNLLLRLLQKVLAPLRERKAESQAVIASERNLMDLKNAVAKAGFEGIGSKLDNQIRQGQREFTVPLSYYISEKQKMDVNLSFSTDADGACRFEKYQAALVHADNPQGSKKQVFFSQDGIHAAQAQNLLSGRAVEVRDSDLPGAGKSKWIQLDFNDQDPLGNHKLKEFHKLYGFDLQKTVGQLGLTGQLTAKDQQALLHELGNGNRPQVTIIREGKEVKLFIEANPQYKTLNVYDENEKKMSIAQALSGPDKQPLKIRQQIQETGPQKSKRNGHALR